MKSKVNSTIVLNRQFFEKAIKIFDNINITPEESKKIYIYNHIFLILMDTAKDLGYNILDVNMFLFINRIYSEIIVKLNSNSDFKVEFIPENNDIIFEEL